MILEIYPDRSREYSTSQVMGQSIYIYSENIEILYNKLPAYLNSQYQLLLAIIPFSPCHSAGAGKSCACAGRDHKIASRRSLDRVLFGSWSV